MGVFADSGSDNSLRCDWWGNNIVGMDVGDGEN